MMRYEDVADKITQKSGVTHSTMMKSSCLRYKCDFIEMMFEKKDSLIIIVALDRVDELIANGMGMEFNFTKKKFKEWVLIPLEFEDKYETYINEALEYAKSKSKPKRKD